MQFKVEHGYHFMPLDSTNLKGIGSLMVRRSGSIDSGIWNNHSLKVPVNPDNNHSPLLSKAMHIGYINKMTCRLLLLTRHCLQTCSFFLVLQTVHSFVGTLYLVFLLLVINSTMGKFCCLKYFFFFARQIASETETNVTFRKAGVMNFRTVGWTMFSELWNFFYAYGVPLLE